ncbi:uncharacterized protein LOC143845590 isoform X1 [Tasmannia lanceolata]|uniref:uncharacterized protein LOC143845590 isoform X1 n=1 Tax=Tasmannia lanceolata TaxID=3420 RepID=UPI004064759B
MANPLMEALLPVLLAFFFVSSAFASFEAPFMVAHKKVTLSRLKSGAEKVSVSIDIYNRGSETAYDVSLSDDSWAKDVFDLVSGNTSKSWERLDAGSVVSHSFILESKVKGIFYSAPAIIKFRIPSKSVLQEAYSTPIQPLDILADRPPEKKFEWVSSYYRLFHFVVVLVTISNVNCCFFMKSHICQPNIFRRRGFWQNMDHWFRCSRLYACLYT